MKKPLTENELLFLQIQELTLTLDYVNAYVFTKDCQGSYTYANKKVCDLFKCSLDKLIGKTDAAFFDLATTEKLQENDQRVIEHGETIEYEEINIIKTTNERRIYSCKKSPLRNNKGEVTGICGIATDITTQRALEAKVEKQKRLIERILDNKELMIKATQTLIKNVF